MASRTRTRRPKAPQAVVVQLPSRPSLSTLVDAGWATFTSVRLAIVLIFSLAAGSVAGAGLMQAPPPALADPQQYELWLVAARDRYGMWTDLLSSLQLFQVFTSIWFRLLLTLLAANIAICTLNRTPRLLAMVRRVPTPVVSREMFERAPLTAAVTPDAGDLDAAEAAAMSVLRSHRFRLYAERSDGALHIVGEKNRYMRLGTLAHHAGLIMVLLAVVAGGRGGFHESQFVIAEGDERDVGHDTGLTVRLNSFVDEYYAGGGGMPKDYRSDIVVLKDGVEVKAGTVRVNEPVVYDGIRIHQSFYGPAVSMRVAQSGSSSSSPLFAGRVPLSFTTQGRAAGSFTIPEQNIEIFLVAPASSFVDEVIKAGEVRVEIFEVGGSKLLAMENLVQGEPQTIGPLTLTFERESRFTGLQVVKDPGLPFVWLGSGIVVLGAMVALNFPHRRVWARVDRDAHGRVTVRFAAPRERGLPFEYEFKGMRESLERRLLGSTSAR